MQHILLRTNTNCRQTVAFTDYALVRADKWGSKMRTDARAGFDPVALKQLYGAFDTAWDNIKDSTDEADRDSVREVVGKAIFGLARHGYSNTTRLAHYGAYCGQLYNDLRI